MAKARIVYRKNRLLKNGEYPVVLRIIHLDYPAIYIRIPGLSVKDETEWNSELSRFSKLKNDYKEHNKTLTNIEEKADSTITNLLSKGDFTLAKFRSAFCKRHESALVLISFTNHLLYLKQAKKYGTAEAYTASMNSLKSFTNLSMLTFSDIDFKFLLSFEHHLRLKGNSDNTISYKIRPLRALHYKYCNESEIPQTNAYRRFKIGRLNKTGSKRFLTSDQLRSIFKYIPMNESEKIAKDIFMFSFLTRGMNMADIARLKHKDISGNTLLYNRAKTGTTFTISITEQIREIISDYSSTGYIFPILKPTHKDDKYSIRLFTKYVNNNLSRIANKLDIPKLTTYYARHSFSALARENGFSVEMISQALGHSDIRTTKAYLNSFADDQIDEMGETIYRSIIGQ